MKLRDFIRAGALPLGSHKSNHEANQRCTNLEDAGELSLASKANAHSLRKKIGERKSTN